MRVRDAADVGAVAIDEGVRGSVRRRREVALDEGAVQVADDDRIRRELFIGNAAGLDDHQLLAGDARREVAARPRDEPVTRQLGVQRADLAAERADLIHAPVPGLASGAGGA